MSTCRESVYNLESVPEFGDPILFERPERSVSLSGQQQCAQLVSMLLAFVCPHMDPSSRQGEKHRVHCSCVASGGGV